MWKLLDHDAIGMIHADPPYGQRIRTNNSRRKRSNMAKTMATGKDYPALRGDDEDFEPRDILALKKPTVLWGADCFPQHLPPSLCWLSWLKRGINANGFVDSDDGSDHENAWTNFAPFPAGSRRTFYHPWRGLCRASEVAHAGNRTIHPTQKPEKLCEWVFLQAVARGKLKPGQTIFVPFGGSMPEINPALALGCPVVLCEVELQYVKDALALRLGVGQGSGASAAHEATLNPRQVSMFGE